MRRTRHLVALATAAGMSCTFVTDTCACTLPVPTAVLAGAVQTAANAPASGALITVEPVLDAPCSAVAQDPLIVVAMSDGRFRHVAPGYTSGSQCFRLFARPAGAATGPTSDTANVIILFGGPKAVPDSVEVLLRLR